MQSTGETQTGPSRKRVTPTPSVKPPGKRGRKAPLLNQPSSSLGDPATREQDSGFDETITQERPSKSNQTYIPNRKTAGLQNEPQHSTPIPVDTPIAESASIVHKVGEALDYKASSSVATVEQTSNEPGPSAGLARPIPISASEDTVRIIRATGTHPGFVFVDPDNEPPPPLPEGHKLVHIVRHCRAWHK